MAISLSNVTGDTITGLTNPTYTVTADTPPPGVRGKQYYVSALGGTQTGVASHSAGIPFTLTWESPPNPRPSPAISSSSGQPLTAVRNKSRMLVRKGLEVVSGYYQVGSVDISFNIPAGAEQNDPLSLIHI